MGAGVPPLLSGSSAPAVREDVHDQFGSCSCVSFWVCSVPYLCRRTGPELMRRLAHKARRRRRAQLPRIRTRCPIPPLTLHVDHRELASLDEGTPP